MKRIILNDYSSDFNKLLQNNNDKCNHHRNIQTVESILNKGMNAYNLQNFLKFVMERKRTVRHGLETLSCQYPQVWSRLQTVKEMNPLSQFKRYVKNGFAV